MIISDKKMNDCKIECINLGKKFTRNRQIVNAVFDINVCIRPGEMVLIKGRSGAGKSTLLNLMCGLIKPTHGKVLIDNKNINELSNNALSGLLLNSIGIIFQSFNLLPTYTVFENIEVALAPKGLTRKEIEKSVIPLLEQFNLGDVADLLPSELSVGQQQKVAIIRTLVKQPSILFADEPTGSVDVETAGEILQHIRVYKEQKEVTIVVATHGSVPDEYADRLIIIENGSVKNRQAD
jgi:putative ABC transport system ATP-binding protein